MDEWMKEIAPSTAPRKWFGHAPERWPEFRRRYRSEIQQHAEQFDRLRTLAQHGRITPCSQRMMKHTMMPWVLKDLLLGGS